jgi:hypothetical protein
VLSHHVFFFNLVAMVFADILDLSTVVFRDFNLSDVFLLVHDLLFHTVLLLNPDEVMALLQFIVASSDL